jgi:2'-5' RNA ligase
MKFIKLDEWIMERENFDSKKSKKKDEEEKTFGCVMMETKIPDWEEYHTAGIDEEDVYIKPHDKSYGLEEQPHVTVVYGIHEDEIDEETIANVIKENMKPLTVTIDEVDIFEGDEYDVVKYNIPVTDQLMEYRKLFLKFPNTQSYPDYHPHMTIAYVKPGTGKKYKRKLREPFEVTFTKGVYSWHDNPEDPNEFKRKVINLEEDKKIPGVNESIEFERGLDPYDALEIGEKRYINKIVNIVYPITSQSIWDEAGYDSPTKADIKKWAELISSYSSAEEILEEEPRSIADSFEEWWMEENEK